MPSHSTAGDDDRQYLLSAPHSQQFWHIHAWLGVCPSAQTMVADDVDRHQQLIYALPCNQWSCRHCALRKTKALAFRTEAAAPNRLCTLTVDPSLYATPRESFDATRRKLPEWIKRMRTKFGEVEYLRVTEVTKRGWPHYHLLIRSGFIPHAVARDEWFLLTGASIVDLRQVKKSFRTYSYLVKYLTKLHHITWTGRHVSYSRQFFTPSDWAKKNEHSIENHKMYACHPATFMMSFAPGSKFDYVSPRSWHYVHNPDHDDRLDPPPQIQRTAFEDNPQFPGDGESAGIVPCDLEPAGPGGYHIDPNGREEGYTP